MAESFWEKVKTDSLRQGDVISNCMVPEFAPDYGRNGKVHEVPVKEYDLIIVSQSCDLENKKLDLVTLCPIYSIKNFEEHNPDFKKKRAWERVRKGREEGLHLLSSYDEPDNNRKAMVVVYKAIYSLPFVYLERKVKKLGDRYRLKSPYLEHFSQSFARFFMRVGLPSQIPEYS